MSEPARKKATGNDLLSIPHNLAGEIIIEEPVAPACYLV